MKEMPRVVKRNRSKREAKERDGYYWDVIDYRKSRKVRLMNHEARGVYRDILDEIWLHGPIPNDVDKIAVLINTPPDVVLRVWHQIHDCLVPTKHDPDLFTSERIEIERKRRDDYRKQKIEAGHNGGVKSGETRRAKAQKTEDTAEAKPKQSEAALPKNEAKPKQNEANSSTSTSIKNTSRKSGYTPEFENFWEHSTRRGSKHDAFREWSYIKPDTDLTGIINAKMAQARASPDWTKDGGKYAPHVCRWLKRKGWEEEYPSLFRVATSKPQAVC